MEDATVEHQKARDEKSEACEGMRWQPLAKNQRPEEDRHGGTMRVTRLRLPAPATARMR